MSAVVGRLWAPVLAAVALGYLAFMLLEGALPERGHLVRFEANGVLQMAPEAITRVRVTVDGTSAGFVRQAEGWVADGSTTPVDARLGETLDRAVKFMHTANPVRALGPEEIAAAGAAEFGLDRPPLSIALEDATGVVLEADFGSRSPDGLLRYMRLKDGDQLYLMSDFVGQEWEAVAAGGRADAAAPARFLVPLSMTDVAAVELLARGQPYRFERDPTGAWLLHQHAAGADPNQVHRADPGQSERIARALMAFGNTQIDGSIARSGGGDVYGLLDPEVVIALFTPDPAQAPITFTVGDLAPDDLGRYVLMPDGAEIVTVADAEITTLLDQLTGPGP